MAVVEGPGEGGRKAQDPKVWYHGNIRQVRSPCFQPSNLFKKLLTERLKRGKKM